MKVTDVDDNEVDENEQEETRPQRRPGRTEKMASNKTKNQDLEEEFTESDETEKVEINFKGSELLRSRFPKPFKFAEAVATDWVHEGSFENLPVGHPLAQWAAQKGLSKAKQLEKKVLESPQLEKVAMSALTWGMKAQGIFQKMKSKVSGSKDQ